MLAFVVLQWVRVLRTLFLSPRSPAVSSRTARTPAPPRPAPAWLTPSRSWPVNMARVPGNRNASVWVACGPTGPQWSMLPWETREWGSVSRDAVPRMSTRQTASWSSWCFSCCQCSSWVDLFIKAVGLVFAVHRELIFVLSCRFNICYSLWVDFWLKL